MKKIIFIGLLFINSLVYSQDYLDAIAKETCECIKAKNMDISKATKMELQAALGACMITSYAVHKEKLEPNDRVEYSDKQGMRRIGETVGLKMMTHCPNLIMALSESDDKDEESKISEDLMLEGIFLETKISDFLTISIKEKVGRVYDLLVLGHFENLELITSKQIKKNDKISITYYEYEIYDAKLKDYRKYKIISGLKKI